MEIKEITFIRHDFYQFEVKLAKNLKKKGYKINSISFYNLHKDQQEFFDKSYYLLEENQRNYSKIKKLLKIPKFFLNIRKIKKSIAIGISEPNWFVKIIFLVMGRRAEKKIYFPYDITFFRHKNYKKNPWFERVAEKNNYTKCDGIIHKGPENELENLPKSFQTIKKPRLQFLPYCDDDILVDFDDNYLKEKLSKKDKEIHLVYVGGVYHNRPAHYPTIDVFKDIVKQKIYLDAFITSYDYIVDDPDYKLLQKNKYFNMRKPIYSNKLQKELSKYDWGIVIFLTNFENLKKLWADTAYGYKTSTYLEAGLPNIVYSGLRFSADVVKENGFGIVIDDINDLKNEISKTNYDELLKKLMKNRSDFTIGKNIPRLEEFIKKL